MANRASIGELLLSLNRSTDANEENQAAMDGERNCTESTVKGSRTTVAQSRKQKLTACLPTVVQVFGRANKQ
ncbi:MAG TPA: hypothetical protein DDZ51_05890 [Planctomycetaceae bacterium]|nr:hypothetical protein [Planctomycetaceae bacterium]